MSFRNLIALAFVASTAGSLDSALGQWPPSITYPEPLNTNATYDSGSDYQTSIATDEQGTWVAVWCSSDTLGGTIGNDKDILFSRSTNDGVTWSGPEVLNSNAFSDSAADDNPVVETDQLGTWIVTWHSDDDLGATIDSDLDILYSRSTDGGITWTSALPLNTTAGSGIGTDFNAQLAYDEVGIWIAVWASEDSLDETIGTDFDILFSRSINGGTDWDDPRPLNTTAYSDDAIANPGDGEPHLVTGSDLWIAVFVSGNDLNGTIYQDWDILYSRSMDHGETWEPPAAIHPGVANGDDGNDWLPSIATDGRGNWVTLWGTDNSIFGPDYDILVSRSADNGVSWTEPKPIDEDFTTNDGSENAPTIITDTGGNWLAAWQTVKPSGGPLGTDHDLLLSWSASNGSTWTAPIPLNTNGALDSRADGYQGIATDFHGRWVAIWSSEENLGGTIGEDWDVLVARFRLYPPGTIPALSEWGVVAMTLLVLTAGTVVMVRRRVAVAAH